MSIKIYEALLIYLCITFAMGKKNGDKPDWAKKDIRDYNDADIERLYEQWEEDDEPLEPDELPEHLRSPPKIDLSNLDPSNPEVLLKMSKKGRSLMTFLTVAGNPTRKETEDITGLWQMSLMNNHINVDKFTVGDNRVIFMFKDGSQAWDAKDYLLEQPRLEVMTIENKEYRGKYHVKKVQSQETISGKPVEKKTEL